MQENLNACELNANTEYLHGLAKLVNRRECRSDTDIAVLGILAIWECSTCAGHYNACFLSEGYNALCTAGEASKEMK